MISNKVLIGGGVLALLFLSQSKKNSIEIKDIINSLKKSATLVYPTRALSQINKIIVHHSATTSGTAASYANYHVDTRGWPGVGYHFVVDQDGTINQTNYLTTISNHTSGQNTAGIGICLTGNFDTQQPFPAQMRSLNALISYLKQTVAPNLQVYGHRDYSTKSCPGNNIALSSYNPQIASIYPTGDCPTLFPCKDGFFSSVKGRGACAQHGGLSSSPIRAKRTKPVIVIPPPAKKEQKPKQPKQPKQKKEDQRTRTEISVGDVIGFTSKGRNEMAFVYTEGKAYWIDYKGKLITELEISTLENVQKLDEPIKQQWLLSIQNHVFSLSELIRLEKYKWKNVRVSGIPRTPIEAYEVLKDVVSAASGTYQAAMSGVNFDDNGITATNAHVLINIPINLTGIIDQHGIFDKRGNLIDERYPNVEAVIPGEIDTELIKIDLAEFMNFCAIVEKSKIAPTTNRLACKYNDILIGINASLTTSLLETLLKLENEIGWYVGISKKSTGSRALVFTKLEMGYRNDVLGLLMPVMLSGNDIPSEVYTPGVIDLDFNRTLPYTWDFNKNCIVDSEGNKIQLKNVI